MDPHRVYHGLHGPAGAAKLANGCANRESFDLGTFAAMAAGIMEELMNPQHLSLADLERAGGGTNWLGVLGGVVGAMSGFGGNYGNRGYYDIYDDGLGGYVVEDVGYGLDVPGYSYGSPLVGAYSPSLQYPQFAQYSQFGRPFTEYVLR